jgi:hypothetical protein
MDSMKNQLPFCFIKYRQDRISLDKFWLSNLQRIAASLPTNQPAGLTLQSESCSGVQMPMERRMLQRKLTFVPSVLALALASISWVTSTGAARASEKCLTAPNAPAPPDEHWYYRTDRATNRQCWYLASRDTPVRKRATDDSKLSRSQLPLPPQAPSRTPWPKGAALDGNSDAGDAATNGAVPGSAISWSAPGSQLPLPPQAPSPAPWPKGATVDANSEAGDAAINGAVPDSTISGSKPDKSAEEPPSLERETPRSSDPIGLAPEPASGRTDQLHAATPVKVAAGVSPMIVITLALLALFGPTYYTVRWLRLRKARDHWNTERPYSAPNEFDTDTGRRLNADSPEQIAETLQQLLNEVQAKLYAAPDAVRSSTEQNRISARA